MLAAFMGLWTLATVPVSLRVFLSVTASDLPLGTLHVRFYGFNVMLHFRLIRKEERLFLGLKIGEDGKERLFPIELGAPRQPSLLRFAPLKQQLFSFLQANGLRLRIGTGDAAATALCCAAIQSLNMLRLPFALYAEPIYDVSTFVLQLRCISFFRLGKLWITALLLLAAQLMKKFSGGIQHGNAKTAA